jgi:hypothetical protein
VTAGKGHIRRHIYWRPWDDPGLEHLCLDFGDAGIKATGLVLRMLDGRHLRCRYELKTDPAWRFKSLSFAVADSGSGDNTRLALARDDAGAWAVNGAAVPELDGCIDVDIQVTPFTNSLPIRRLGLGTGKSADIRVAYVPVPELDVRPAEQRYTCQEACGPAGGRYRYEGLFRNFTAELPVDEDGLVLDYAETFRRIWPR